MRRLVCQDLCLGRGAVPRRPLPRPARGLAAPVASPLAGDWHFPVPTHFGAGRAEELGSVLKSQGSSRPLLVTDRGLAESSLVSGLMDGMSAAGLRPLLFAGIQANPTDVNVAAGARAFREHEADGVVAMGGGSALDGGKCIAMVARTGVPLPNFEWTNDPVSGVEPMVVGDASRGIPPVVAIPTTAGTGAEMNAASMYTDTAAQVKRCVTHPACRITVIADPLLTVSLPAHLTAWTGMDALTHAIEAYCVDAYHPMCDGIALEAMALIKRWLPVAHADGSDVEARAHMLAASSLAAAAFQKGLGAVHGLSEPIGAVHDTQHGLTNAIILPRALRANGAAIEDKCCRIAHNLALRRSSSSSGVDAVVEWVEELSASLGIPRSLRDIGLDSSTAALCAAKAEANPTGWTNPIRFSASDYEELFRQSLVA